VARTKTESLAATAVDSPPESSAWRHGCNGLAQYVAATVAAVLVLAVFFPGNRFLPVPWQHDDYNFLAAPMKFHGGLGVEWLSPRPVAQNIAWRLGLLGEMPYYIGMFLMATLIPVAAVHLALRLFRCQPGPRIVVMLAAGVSACAFLFEHSLWCYRYTLITNLASVGFGLFAAYAFSTWLDGRRAGFVAGCLLFLASAFSKEDVLLFVPLYVGADWCIRRWYGTERAPFSRLASAYGAIAAVGGLLFVWNRWIVPSPFTNSSTAPYKLDFSAAHIGRQIWSYIVTTEVTKMAFAALLLACLLGVCRRRQRLAALAMLPLVAALLLPYSVLPRFFEYYSLNWIALVVALAAVCMTAVCRDWLPPRFAAAAWAAPLALLAAAFVYHPGAADCRRNLTAWLNQQQAECQYVVAQLERNRAELADADTIAVCGADETFSPWLLSDGAYANMKMGHEVHWIFAVKPQSLVAKFLDLKNLPRGGVTAVLDKDLPSCSYAAVLNFDKNLNMTVARPANQARAARAPTAAR
jgi:hypothetical protein